MPGRRLRQRRAQDGVVPRGAVCAVAEVRLPALGGAAARELLAEKADLAEAVDGDRRIFRVADREQVRGPGGAAVLRADQPQGVDARDQRREGHVDGVAVARVDGRADVAAPALLPVGGDTRLVEGKAEAGRRAPAGQPVRAVGQRRELRSAGPPIVVAHDDELGVRDDERVAGEASRARDPSVEGRVDRAVAVHGRADLGPVLPERRPLLDPDGAEGRQGGAAVERLLDGRGLASRRVEVVDADIDTVRADAGPAHHGRGLHIGLVLVGPVLELGHHRRAREVGRPVNLEVPGAAVQDRREEPARGAGELQRDVARAEAPGARHDVVEGPAAAPVCRDVDGCRGAAHRVGREGRARDLLRIGRVDGDVRLAVLVGLAAERLRDHVDDGDHLGLPGAGRYLRARARTRSSSCSGR